MKSTLWSFSVILEVGTLLQSLWREAESTHHLVGLTTTLTLTSTLPLCQGHREAFFYIYFSNYKAVFTKIKCEPISSKHCLRNWDNQNVFNLSDCVSKVALPILSFSTEDLIVVQQIFIHQKCLTQLDE